MAFVFKRLSDIQTIPSSIGSIFSNPAGIKSEVKLITLFNSNTTPETVKIYRVPDSAGSLGTPAVTNQIFQFTMTSLSTLLIDFPGQGLVLENENDSIQAVTTTASKVVISIDGAQE